MPDQSHIRTKREVDARLSQELGVDVVALEIQLLFRLDHERMQAGQPGQLGYVLMDRLRTMDAAIVYNTPEIATRAMEEDILIESLAQEDCDDCYVPTSINLVNLKGREIILAENPDGAWDEG